MSKQPNYDTTPRKTTVREHKRRTKDGHTTVRQHERRIPTFDWISGSKVGKRNLGNMFTNPSHSPHRVREHQFLVDDVQEVVGKNYVVTVPEQKYPEADFTILLVEYYGLGEQEMRKRFGQSYQKQHDKIISRLERRFGDNIKVGSMGFVDISGHGDWFVPIAIKDY